MKLSYLIEDLDKKKIKGDISCDINKIAFDSREVEPGTLFVAIKGTKTDGHDYIADALKKGAAAIVIEHSADIEGIPVIRVPDSRKALAVLATRFYDYPAKRLKVIGITGTNGKTTTSHMIAGVLESHGIKTGIIGTLYIKILDKIIPARVTTPESLEIQRYLSQMVDAGVEAVVMEVSSHALHFDRVAGIEFDGAVFTNLTQDHLDFHKDLDEYFNAKKMLFSRIKSKVKGGFAILNSDDVRTGQIIPVLSAPYKSYGIYRKCDIRAKDIKTKINGTSFIAENDKWDVPVQMGMVGEFNIYNALAAVGVGMSMGIPPAQISRGLKNMPVVRGRFEIVDKGQPFGVVVDYAHTPDGLQNVLESAKKLVENRLIAVFGCGGDRDRTKRPIMGRIASELADIAIVTSDNPRTEDPSLIIKDIEAGITKKDYIVEVDRKKAIFKAIEIAKEGDIIVIAGKGHETYQIFKNETIHFDDTEVAAEALSQITQNA